MSDENKDELKVDENKSTLNQPKKPQPTKQEQKKRQKDLANARKSKRDEEKIKANALKRDYSGRQFDPEDLFYDFFKPKGLSTDAMQSLINHGGTERMTSDDEYTKSATAFFEYSKKVQDENIEFDPSFIRSLNQKNLLHLGVLGDGNMPNKFTNEGERKKMAFEVFDKMFLSRRIDHEALIDVLAIHTGIDSSKEKHSEKTLSLLKEYMELPHRENVLFKKLEALENNGSLKTSTYKKDKIKALLSSKEYLDVKKMEYSVDDIDDINSQKVKDSLTDINKTIMFDKGVDVKSKKGLSITENNDNLFLNKKVEFRDQDFYKRMFNKEIESNESLHTVSATEKVSSYWENIRPWNKGEKRGDPFKVTVMQTDKDGNQESLINISRVSKSIVVDTMPNNDQVYKLMAIAAKMKGIKKPVINCFEKNPEDRVKFVSETLKELIALDYDINDIKVPKDMEHLKQNYMVAKQGIAEGQETPDEKPTDVNSKKGNNENTPKETKNNESIPQEINKEDKPKVAKKNESVPKETNKEDKPKVAKNNENEPEEQANFSYASTDDEITGEGGLDNKSAIPFTQNTNKPLNDNKGIPKQQDNLDTSIDDESKPTIVVESFMSLLSLYKNKEELDKESSNNPIIEKLKDGNEFSYGGIEGIKDASPSAILSIKLESIIGKIVSIGENIDPETRSESLPGLNRLVEDLKKLDLSKKKDSIEDNTVGHLTNMLPKLEKMGLLNKEDIISPLSQEDINGKSIIIKPKGKATVKIDTAPKSNASINKPK